MACTINASVGTVEANSFADIATADAYHDGHLEGEYWLNLDEAQKCAALQMASRLVSSMVHWRGYRANPVQALEWPRFGVYDAVGYPVGAADIPAAVVQATAELARRLAKRSNDVRAAQAGGVVDTSAFKSIKAGPVTLEYQSGAAAQAPTVTLDDDVFVDEVFHLLSGLGRLKGRGGIRSIGLRRV